jgi:ABC-type nitrate/sulfonate/bicarbonate transport system substrate-binding protein
MAVETPEGEAASTRRPLSLKVIAFAGASNWPLWVGQELGFFAVEGIELTLEMTVSSVQMAQALHSGAAQVALTSIDNVIAYANGRGEIPLDGPAKFFAFMGVDDGLLSVMADPAIADIAGLRGRTLAVDALTTGFAFVLKEILAQHHIGEADVSYVSVGTGAQRLAALKAGTCSATLLNAPLCLVAESAGSARLLRAREALGRYQGIVGAAQLDWAESNRAALEAFIRAFHRSLQWLNAPDNRTEACSILTKRLPILGEAVDSAYRVLILEGGLEKSLTIDRVGTARVIELREKHGERHGDLGGPDRYIDDSFLCSALT